MHIHERIHQVNNIIPGGCGANLSEESFQKRFMFSHVFHVIIGIECCIGQLDRNRTASIGIINDNNAAMQTKFVLQ